MLDCHKCNRVTWAQRTFPSLCFSLQQDLQLSTLCRLHLCVPFSSARTTSSWRPNILVESLHLSFDNILLMQDRAFQHDKASPQITSINLLTYKRAMHSSSAKDRILFLPHFYPSKIVKVVKGAAHWSWCYQWQVFLCRVWGNRPPRWAPCKGSDVSKHVSVNLYSATGMACRSSTWVKRMDCLTS